MRLSIKLGFLIFTLFGFNANAEGNCPPGYFPVGGGNSGYVGCAPNPGGPATNNQDIVNQLRGMGPDRPKWLNSYGALAIGKNKENGGFMYAYRIKERSETRAIEQAFIDCQNAGFLECKTVTSFWNGYLALASGDDGQIYFGAEQKENKAKKIALEECKKKTTKCEVFKTADSRPDKNY